ncbi:hypothetical protein [Leptolyngbya sp. Cla-17]|nr:hypothetical protein [Leptolyngbya sp. Cla-17]
MTLVTSETKVLGGARSPVSPFQIGAQTLVIQSICKKVEKLAPR